MLDVFFTVDVEIWCDGWSDLDARFPAAFRSYIYGPTPSGDYGLPYQLALLNEHGLKGVFFIEPLFSGRFGMEPLREIVGLIREAGQETQLHLHTEWVDESRWPMLEGVRAKRQYLRYFDRAEQTRLIALGCELMQQAGAARPNTFRAGSFGFNRDTLQALVANGIPFDCSYNACMFGRDSGLAPGSLLTDCTEVDGVHEFPMTVFANGVGRLCHAQLTACSFRELEGLLWQALERGQSSFMLLSHNFELLNLAKNRPDDLVVQRMRQLCRFLDRHRDVFRVRGFEGLQPRPRPVTQQPLQSAAWKTGLRLFEQVYRRRYG